MLKILLSFFFVNFSWSSTSFTLEINDRELDRFPLFTADGQREEKSTDYLLDLYDTILKLRSTIQEISQDLSSKIDVFKKISPHTGQLEYDSALVLEATTPVYSFYPILPICEINLLTPFGLFPVIKAIGFNMKVFIHRLYSIFSREIHHSFFSHFYRSENFFTPPSCYEQIIFSFFRPVSFSKPPLKTLTAESFQELAHLYSCGKVAISMANFVLNENK